MRSELMFFVFLGDLSNAYLLSFAQNKNLIDEKEPKCLPKYLSASCARTESMMATLPPAIAGSGAGGGKKPFSYCPGGIDFSELKSPKIARRILPSLTIL